MLAQSNASQTEHRNRLRALSRSRSAVAVMLHAEHGPIERARVPVDVRFSDPFVMGALFAAPRASWGPPPLQRETRRQNTAQACYGAENPSDIVP